MYSETQIPSLIGGMSEQAHALRLSSQCDHMSNMLPTLKAGICKRPPSMLRKHLGRISPKKVQTHIIKRDKNEQYLVLVMDGVMKIFDTDGKEYPIKNNNHPYLKSTENLAFVTIHDVTFIVNKDTQIAMNEKVKSPKRAPEALIFLKNVSYDAKYSIHLGGHEFSALTPRMKVIAPNQKNQNAPNIFKGLKPEILLNKIKADMDKKLGKEFHIETFGPIMKLSRIDKKDFTIEVFDSEANSQLAAFKDIIPDFHKLPAEYGFHHFTIQIDSNPTTEKTSYFARYEVNQDKDKGAGIWRECVAPDTILSLDESTMPHVLKRLEDGSFEITTGDWKDRRAGNEKSNPNPNFVGSCIRDIFVYRNRLGFLCDDQVILSQGDDYFNFFRFTTTRSLSDQPITIAASHSTIAKLNFAVPYMRNILIFSDFGVFILESGEACTPSTTSLSFLSPQASSETIRPCILGQFVYFPINVGSFTSLQEYGADVQHDRVHHADISAHVPELIKAPLDQMSVSDNGNYLLIKAKHDKNKMIIYKPFWIGPEKVQSAFCLLKLAQDDHVHSFAFLNEQLWMMINHGDDLILETIDFSEKNLDKPVFLDHQIILEKGDIENGFKSMIKLSEAFQIMDSNGVFVPFDIDKEDPYHCIIHTKAHTEFPLYMGRSYNALFRFSQFFTRDGNSHVIHKKTLLQQCAVNYQNTRYFTVKAMTAHQDFDFIFNGKIINEPQNRLDKQHQQDGVFKFPVRGDSQKIRLELHNDSPFPAQFLSASFKSKRLR